MVPSAGEHVTVEEFVLKDALHVGWNCVVPMKHSNDVSIECTDTLKVLNLAYFVLEKEYYV
jgi:hypothetical protein